MTVGIEIQEEFGISLTYLLSLMTTAPSRYITPPDAPNQS